MKQTVTIGFLVFVGSIVGAQSFADIHAIISAAAGDEPGVFVIEVSRESEYGGRMYTADLSTGWEVYVENAGNGPRVFDRERERLDSEDRRAIRALENNADHVTLAEAVRRTIEESGEALAWEDFYSASYDFEYGRLVVEVDFRARGGWGRTEGYVDAFTGEVLQIRNDD